MDLQSRTWESVEAEMGFIEREAKSHWEKVRKQANKTRIDRSFEG